MERSLPALVAKEPSQENGERDHQDGEDECPRIAATEGSSHNFNGWSRTTRRQSFRAAPDAFDRALGKSMQSLDVAITECARPRREDLEHAQQFLLVQYWNDENRAHAETAAGDGVNARIGFSVIADLHLHGPDTCRRESGNRIQAHSKIRSGGAGGGPAYDIVSAAQCDGGARSVSGQAGLFDDLI